MNTTTSYLIIFGKYFCVILVCNSSISAHISALFTYSKCKNRDEVEIGVEFATMGDSLSVHLFLLSAVISEQNSITAGLNSCNVKLLQYVKQERYIASH